MAVLVVTGGGAQALADLFAVPGASRTVLEALVPYGDRSMREFWVTSRSRRRRRRPQQRSHRRPTSGRWRSGRATTCRCWELLARLPS